MTKSLKIGPQPSAFRNAGRNRLKKRLTRISQSENLLGEGKWPRLGEGSRRSAAFDREAFKKRRVSCNSLDLSGDRPPSAAGDKYAAAIAQKG